MDTKAFNLSKVEDISPIIEESKRGWYTYGKDNMYPKFLLDCRKKSSLLNAIIQSVAYYIYGNGFNDYDKPVNKRGETLYDIVSKNIIDYLNFGGMCLQVLRNMQGKVIDLYWVDPIKVRLGDDKAWYSPNWKNAKNKKEYPLNDNKASNSIWYFKSPISRDIYGEPLWHSAIKSVKTDIEIVNFHLNSVSSKFMPTMMISFNDGGNLDEERKSQIERAIKDKFQGTDANMVMLNFCDSAENAPTILTIPDDSYDTKYTTLRENSQQNIYNAFRISPMLVGVDYNKTGFSANEYKEAIAIYLKTFVRPLQSEIEAFYSKIKDNDGTTPFAIKFNEFEPQEVFKGLDNNEINTPIA